MLRRLKPRRVNDRVHPVRFRADRLRSNLRIGIELEVFAQQLHQTADCALFRYVGVPPPQCSWLTLRRQKAVHDGRFLAPARPDTDRLVLLASNYLIATAEVTKLMQNGICT